MLLAACGSATTDTEVLPQPPMSFALLAPADGACVAIGTEVTARIPIQFAANNVLLRTVGACGSNGNCGSLKLRAGAVDNNQGASLVVDLLLGKLANPYHDGAPHPGTGKPNVLPIEASLLAENGASLLDVNGTPLTLTFGLIIKPSCP